MRFLSVKEAGRWWLAPGPSRYVRVIGGLVLGCWTLWELGLGTDRWRHLAAASGIWWALFPVAIPLLSLCALPPLASLVMIPTIFTGQGNRTVLVLTALGCGILLAALAAVLPFIQYYVRLSLIVWF